MKVGLLTMPLHVNYGGILQAYALQTVLERTGHEVDVITEPYHRNALSLQQWHVYAKRLAKKLLIDHSTHVLKEKYDNKVYPVLSQYTQPFIDNHIKTILRSDVKEVNERGWDALVVGSDQIWRPMYYPAIADAFFDFAKNWNVKRFSYAASFGTDKWEYSELQTNQCRELVQLFDAVSVREDSGMALCKRYLNVDAEHVLDPTMLLNALDYASLIPEHTVSSGGALVTYILDTNSVTDHIVEKVASSLKLSVKKSNSKFEDFSAEINERIQPPIEQWLNYFKDASFIVADSFHACVFSLLFHKQFLVVANSLRGNARMESLLRMFNLVDRIVYDETDIETRLESKIDYQKVEEVLSVLREKSLNFLKKNLI